MLRQAVVRGECLFGRTKTTTVASCEYGAADVSIVTDNDVGGIAAAVLHHSHVAATVYIIKEYAALDVDVRLAIYASHA